MTRILPHTLALLLALATALAAEETAPAAPPAEPPPAAAAPVPARPVGEPQAGAQRLAARDAAASAAPAEATPATEPCTGRANPPLDRPRYAAPTGPAPQVGYAPQAGPLPGYPGLAPNATGVPGYPSRTSPSGQLVSLFTDLKASGQGDVLTIVITQQAVAAANGAKQSSQSAGLSFDGGAGLLKFLPGFSMGTEGSQSGATQNSGDFSIATTFTVTVTEVRPNGNLVVEGQQLVNLGGRDQWVKIGGEVRPYDVTPDNTVESTRVANVRIEFVGVRDRGKRKGLFDILGGALEALFGIFS